MKKVPTFGFVFLVFTSTVFAQEGFVNRPITNNLLTPTWYTLYRVEISSISLNRIPLKATFIDQNGQTKVSITRPIIGGILAGAIGFFGGAALGLAIEQGVGCDNTNEMCGLGGLILGAAIGEVLFMPVGIHLGNKRGGNFFLDTLSSIAVGAAGLGASALSKGSIGPFLVVTPIIQIGITTIVERSF